MSFLNGLSWNSEISLELKIIQWRIRYVNKKGDFSYFEHRYSSVFAWKTWKKEKFLGVFLKNAFNDCGLASYYECISISIKFSSSLDQSQHSSSIRLEMTNHRNELILIVLTKSTFLFKVSRGMFTWTVLSFWRPIRGQGDGKKNSESMGF